MSEAPKISEIKSSEGTSFVFRDAINNLDNPNLTTRIQALGFDPSLFGKLITLDYKGWTGQPVELDWPPLPAKPHEHVIIRNAKVEGKDIEVDEITPYESHAMPKAWIRKTPDKTIGFEAFLVKKGSVVYDVLHRFDAIIGGYVSSGDRTSVELKPGDLLVIPHPVARQNVELEEGSKVLYLTDSWDHDQPVEIL